jgi:hypothetical protein
VLFWGLALATLADLAGGDAAGNAYAQAYGALEIIVLWGLLAAIAIIAVVKGAIPRLNVLAALILIPVSGFVIFAVLELLSRPAVSPFLWPIVVLALVPPLITALCVWALFVARRGSRARGRRHCLGRNACSLRLNIAPAANARPRRAASYRRA